jgi:hypothetical protein
VSGVLRLTPFGFAAFPQLRKSAEIGGRVKGAKMLTEVQLFVIATVASGIVWLLKMSNQKIPAGWLTGGVYAVSLGLAYFFAPLALPTFPGFSDAVTFVQALVTWIGAALVPLSSFVGFATLVYNVLLKNVLDRYVKPLFKK